MYKYPKGSKSRVFNRKTKNESDEIFDKNRTCKTVLVRPTTDPVS